HPEGQPGDGGRDVLLGDRRPGPSGSPGVRDEIALGRGRSQLENGQGRGGVAPAGGPERTGPGVEAAGGDRPDGQRLVDLLPERRGRGARAALDQRPAVELRLCDPEGAAKRLGPRLARMGHPGAPAPAYRDVPSTGEIVLPDYFEFPRAFLRQIPPPGPVISIKRSAAAGTAPRVSGRWAEGRAGGGQHASFSLVAGGGSPGARGGGRAGLGPGGRAGAQDRRSVLPGR